MEPPTRPDPEDCCNSGCNPCILDVYEEQLKLYNDRLVKDTKRQFDNKKSCIEPTRLSLFRLVDKKQDSLNTYFFTFEFLHFFKHESEVADDRVVKFSPGQHFFLKAQYGGEEFSRAYTPLYAKGKRFTVLIKLYESGEMSRYLKKLKIGGATMWRGPYHDCLIGYMQKNILFVAQGTGLAPFYSIIEDILKNDDCCTFLKLFLCCRDDILLRDKLQEWAQHWNFTYEVFLTQPGVDFQNKYNEIIHSEKLNFNHLNEYVNKVTMEGLQILICGSETFSQHIKHVLTNDLNCDPNCIVTF